MLVRGATPADYAAYTRLMPELGVDDPVPSAERFAAELVARMIVAEAGGEVIGYALFDTLRGVGYVRNIVTAPDRRRGGVGRALMAEIRARVGGAGGESWCLNVKPTNAAAIALYEQEGMRFAYRTTVFRIAREHVLPPAPEDVVLDALPGAHDGEIEAKFGLVPGQLAHARARPSRDVVQLRRGEEVLGVGVFMPSVPGAFPFRLRAPGDAAAFCARLRERCPADAEFLQVSAEDDDALAQQLRALGAYVKLEIVHMRGVL